MEPLSAIGLAGNIVQFVDFGVKLLIEGREIYNSGSLALNEQIEAATNDLLDFNARFTASLQTHAEQQSLSDNEHMLQKLCYECNQIAEELLLRLSKLKPPMEENKNRAKRVQITLQILLLNAWNKRDVEDLATRLEKYRVAIQTRMIGMLGNQVEVLSIKQSQRFDNLDRETKRIIAILLDDIHTNIADDIRHQTDALQRLISRREIVLPNPSNHTLREVINIDENNTYDLERHQENRLWAATADIVLNSLSFRAKTERQQGVVEAHRKTFDWVFQRNQYKNVKWDSFVDWLESGDGLYWITGKAGSGKSTLMKYIFNNPRRLNYLFKWAGSSTLCTAEFYFWSAGTALQKSEVGLLRSILGTILESNRGIIAEIFPKRWSEAYNFSTIISTPQYVIQRLEQWSLYDLKEGWHRLLQYVGSEENNLKIAIFIDGLDEFDGLDIDMVRLFGSAADMPGVKVCVSSRPHVAFEAAFMRQSSLRLQDLTKDDIRTYIEDRLVKDETMQSLREREPVETEALVEEITQSADGVFLWVFLVVHGLLEGLNNGDDCSDLRRRLRLLPRDLRDLYDHMISRLGEDYKVEAAQFFELMNTSQKLNTDPLEPEPLTVLSFCLAKESIEKLDATTRKYTKSKEILMSDIQDMSRRLKSRTGGLLEVQLLSSTTPSPATKVAYLHRTVRDFLLTQEMKDIFQAETNFDAENVLFNSCAYSIFLGRTLSEIDEAGEQALYDSAILYAKRCQVDSPKENYFSQTHIIDRLYERMLPAYDGAASGSIPYTHWSQSEKRICWALKWGLILYIRDLQMKDEFASNLVKRKFVDFALRTDASFRPKILYELLTVGVDPLSASNRLNILDEARRLSVLKAEEGREWLRVINYLQNYEFPPKKTWNRFRGFMCFGARTEEDSPDITELHSRKIRALHEH